MKQCSECFNENVNQNKFIRYKNSNYCSPECLNYRINMNLMYAWVVFKNLIDEYYNESFDSDTWGSQTLVGTT